jgi:RNA polymerase sigma factor (TIGR02999 family)
VSEVTRILTAIEQGEPCAAEQLLPLVYKELRRLAAQQLAHEKPCQTLQATALVHEAWLRLVGPGPGEAERRWNDRRHFFGAAAEAIRRILVENARRKQRPKHGGHLERVNLVEIASPLADDQLLAVDAALDRLAAVHARAAEVVKLRFFAGLTSTQAAEQLDVSVATLGRLWTFARAWLFDEIRHDLGNAPGVSEKPAENRMER